MPGVLDLGNHNFHLSLLHMGLLVLASISSVLTPMRIPNKFHRWVVTSPATCSRFGLIFSGGSNTTLLPRLQTIFSKYPNLTNVNWFSFVQNFCHSPPPIPLSNVSLQPPFQPPSTHNPTPPPLHRRAADTPQPPTAPWRGSARRAPHRSPPAPSLAAGGERSGWGASGAKTSTLLQPPKKQHTHPVDGCEIRLWQDFKTCALPRR